MQELPIVFHDQSPEEERVPNIPARIIKKPARDKLTPDPHIQNERNVRPPQSAIKKHFVVFDCQLVAKGEFSFFCVSPARLEGPGILEAAIMAQAGRKKSIAV